MSFFWNSFTSSCDEPTRPVAQAPRPKQRPPLIQSKPFQDYSSNTKEDSNDTKPNPFEPLYIYKNAKPSPLNLNQYNINSECTPVHSNYNSPRISVDRLPLFDGSNVLNGGMYKDEKVHGGQFITITPTTEQPLSCNDLRVRLVELHHKYSELQEQLLAITNQLSE